MTQPVGVAPGTNWRQRSAARTSAVIRSWQHRFGARLCSLGIASLVLSVVWPPTTTQHARRVAAQHLAFCSDLADMMPFDQYAGSLIGAGVWAFWWD